MYDAGAAILFIDIVHARECRWHKEGRGPAQHRRVSVCMAMREMADAVLWLCVGVWRD